MKLRDIDLNLLVAFDALMRECHVTRAAWRLDISQSSMSLALAKLRTLFHDPLLVRTAQGLAPSALARDLQPRIEAILQAVDGLVQGPRDLDPQRIVETITLIAIDYIDYVVMPDLVGLLQHQAPDLSLRIVPPNPRRLREVMSTGEIDLALTYFPTPPDNVRTRPLFSDRLVGIARTDHPILKGKMNAERFSAQSQIAIQPADGADMYNALIDNALRELGLYRRVVLTKPTFLGVPFIVGRTELVATLPQRVAERFTQITPIALFELPFEQPVFDIVMMWHDRTHSAAVHHWVREQILDVCARYR